MKAKRMSSRRRKSSEIAATAASSGAWGTVAAAAGLSWKEYTSRTMARLDSRMFDRILRPGVRGEGERDQGG